TSAIRPATAAALVSGEQASVVSGPAKFGGSRACTMFVVIPGAESAAPKLALPMGYSPEIAAGELIVSSGVPGERTSGTAEVTFGPIQTTRRKLIADATRSASVI